MLRNMAASLITADKEYIITTVPKAKELRPFVEKIITMARKAKNLTGDEAKSQEVHLRRQAASYFFAHFALIPLAFCCQFLADYQPAR